MCVDNYYSIFLLKLKIKIREK